MALVCVLSIWSGTQKDGLPDCNLGPGSREGACQEPDGRALRYHAVRQAEQASCAYEPQLLTGSLRFGELENDMSQALRC